MRVISAGPYRALPGAVVDQILSVLIAVALQPHGAPEPRDHASARQAGRGGYYLPAAVPKAVQGVPEVSPHAVRTEDSAAVAASWLPADVFPAAGHRPDFFHWLHLCYLHCHFGFRVPGSRACFQPEAGSARLGEDCA